MRGRRHQVRLRSLLAAGGEPARAERRHRQLRLPVGVFGINILKGSHLLALDGELRAEGRVFCPPSKCERFEPRVRLLAPQKSSDVPGSLKVVPTSSPPGPLLIGSVCGSIFFGVDPALPASNQVLGRSDTKKKHFPARETAAD